MFPIFIRLIPYLYYFIKEMYRRDLNEEMTRKKRAKYRTYVAVLLSLLLLTSVFGLWKMNKMRVTTGQCLVNVTELKQQIQSYATEYVERDRYEKEVSVMSHRIAELQVYNDVMAAKLTSLCDTDKTACEASTAAILSRVKADQATGAVKK